LALRLLHSAKLPEYMPQVFSFGDTALIRAGQVINTMGKLRPNVGNRKAQATSAEGNKPTAANCQRMTLVPTNKDKV